MAAGDDTADDRFVWSVHVGHEAPRVFVARSADGGEWVDASDDELDGTVSWGHLLAETVGRLIAGGFEHDDANREARWIVEEASGLEGTELAAGQDALATERAVARLDAMVGRRLAGEPLQYVLGHWPFRTLDLLVDVRVLIPRPETEQVVEHALRELDRRLASTPNIVAHHRPARGERQSSASGRP